MDTVSVIGENEKTLNIVNILKKKIHKKKDKSLQWQNVSS